MTDIRFAFEALQHDHDAKTFGFATEGPSLTRQEFAEECDINVLMAYGRCLRPALYSSLRSSPSHPTGVSALRVTIAIANARFARKQWGLRKSTAKSRRLFRNESATSRRVRAGAIGGSTAMGRTACCRKSPRVPRVSCLGSWALGTSNPGGQDKANWRSPTRRLSSVDKPLSAHWFLEARRLAFGDIQSRLDGAFRASRGISMSYAMALAIFSSNVSAFHSTTYASLRFCTMSI